MSKIKRYFEYPNLPSDSRPVAHSKVLPLSQRPEPWNSEDDGQMDLGEKEEMYGT
jgi:hypothetical protein